MYIDHSNMLFLLSASLLDRWMLNIYVSDTIKDIYMEIAHSFLSYLLQLLKPIQN